MASSQSVFITALVAMVLGIIIGVVGVTALRSTLVITADEAATQLSNPDPQPQIYGSRG